MLVPEEDINLPVNITLNYLFQINESIEAKDRERKEKEEVIHVKKQTLDLLPDAETNIEKLQVAMS